MNDVARDYSGLGVISMTGTNRNKRDIQIQIDRDLYDDSKRVLDDIGISPTVLINALLKRVVAEGRIPFDIAQTKGGKLGSELKWRVCESNIPVIKDPNEVDRYLLENGDDRYDKHD